GLLRGPSSAFSDFFGALTYLFHSTTGALTYLFHSTTGALTYLFHSTTGALTHVLHSATSALADLLHSTTDALTDLLHSTTDTLGHVFQDLWVPVDGLQNSRDDLSDVVELDLEQGLGLDPFDGEPDPAELHVRSHFQGEQVQHLGLKGNGSS